MKEEIGPTLRAAMIFAIHVIVAGMLFALIAFVASGLYVALQYLEVHAALPSLVTTGMLILEKLIFLIDGACFAFLVVLEGIKFCRRIWADRGVVENRNDS